MNEELIKKIEMIVDKMFADFAKNLQSTFISEVNSDNGIINQKKNNCFIAELGSEFMFYSAFVRSFDSRFGNTLEKMGNSIAKLSYEVNNNIDSFILPEQIQFISNLMASYDSHVKPKISHYSAQTFIIPRNIESFKQVHNVDNYFFDKITKTHYIIELKAGGDLDNKKSKAEKIAMLNRYFLLKNKIIDNTDEQVKIYFATAYNRFGEGNVWKQERVKQFFADDELLIGKDYWNFVCRSKDGFEIIFNQYKKSSKYIKNTLVKIKEMYF